MYRLLKWDWKKSAVFGAVKFDVFFFATQHDSKGLRPNGFRV